MSRRLVVAGTLSDGVLSTSVPVPTDGLPEWWRCERCGMRELPNTGLIYTEHETPDGSAVCQSDSMVPDGPFPFTVGVWMENVSLKSAGCTCWFCCGGLGDGHGAVVATVEVTGPSHHADECADSGGTEFLQTGTRWRYCHPDAAPDGWHTPVGEVTWLDVPTPMERPSGKPSGYAAWGNVNEGPPQRSWWWADLDLQAK